MVLTFVVIAVSVFSVGCAGVAPAPQQPPEPVQVRQSPEELRLIGRMRDDAERTLVRLLAEYRKGDRVLAKQATEIIQRDSELLRTLNTNSQFLFELLTVHLAIDAGENLNEESVILTPQTEEQRIDALDLWSKLLESNREFVQASISSIQAKRLANAIQLPNQEFLSKRLWQTLTALPNKQISELRERFADEDTEPWFILAEQFNRSLSITGWQQFLRTQVDVFLDDEIVNFLLTSTSDLTSEPKRIAVLLPQTGDAAYARAASAIRDGIMLAYLSDSGNRDLDDQPRLSFYDTANLNVNQVLQRAIDDGAEQVIGPLTKDAVNLLSDRFINSVELLMLNKPDQISGRTRDSVRYLTWSIEDEAQKLAWLVSRQPDQHCLVLYGNEPWMIRARAEFELNLSEPARIAGIHRIGEITQITKDVGSALGIAASEKRAESIQSIVNFPLEFQPRVNQEINTLVAFVNADQLETVLESLRFHVDRHIDVYLTESAVRGDLPERANGARFTGSAWQIFDRDLSTETQNLLPPDPNLMSFYTLGMDAYRFSSLLANLAEYRPITGIGSRYFLEATGYIKRLPYVGTVVNGSFASSSAMDKLETNNPYL